MGDINISFACLGWGMVSLVCPILGPGRAITLAVSSFIKPRRVPQSVRIETTNLKKWTLNGSSNTQEYRVITGEEGVGKSCMLQTAIYRIPGVIYAYANGGDSSNTIIENVLKNVGKRTPFTFGDPIAAARRTIFCYNFLFGKSPIAVISATERSVNEPPAKLTAAVRILTETYGLRVIVDSSPNSLDPGIFDTKRVTAIRLEKLTKDQLFSIPEIQKIFTDSHTAAWKDITWAVLGGNPADFLDLSGKIRLAEASHVDVISLFLKNRIFDAIKLVDFALQMNPDMAKFLEKLKESKNVVPTADLRGLKMSSPDKVLRQVETDGGIFFVPASNALSIVISRGWSKKPSTEQLKEIVY